MGLGDRSLGAGFMNQKFGANSTPDEMEYMKLRASEGGKFGVSSFYEETGSMPIAKTLARHYKKGGRRYEDGGTSGGDPWEYKMDGDKVLARKKGSSEWIVTEGAARENILKTQFPEEYNKNSESYGPNSNPKYAPSSVSVPAPGDTSEFIPQQFNAKENNDAAIAQLDNSTMGPNPTPSANLGQTLGGSQGGGDPWEYRMDGDNVLTRKKGDPNWITAQGDSRQAILDQQFPDYEGGVDIGVRPIDDRDVDFGDLYVEDDIPEETAEEWVDPNAPPKTTTTADPNWWAQNKEGISRGSNNLAAGLLNVAPSFGNINRYENMPGVKAPNLQRTVKTDAPSFESSRQAIIAQGNNAANRAQGQSQSNQLAANISSMAGTQSALSQLGGQEAQAIASNDASNANASNQANASNMNRLNQSLEQQTSRELAQDRGIANEWNNIASRSLGFMGDLNNQKLDRDKMELTERRYDRYGTMTRDAEKYKLENGEYPSWYTPYQ